MSAVFAYAAAIDRNQAIADLYRAQAELARAGIGGEYVRGTADDGAPWLSVCDPASGDVVVHVAVIDGQLVADGPGLRRPLRGRDVGTVLLHLISSLGAGLRTNATLLAIIAALAAHHAADLVAANDWLDLPPEMQAALDALASLPALVVLASTGAAIGRYIIGGAPEADEPPAPAASVFEIEASGPAPQQTTPLQGGVARDAPPDLPTGSPEARAAAALAQLADIAPPANDVLANTPRRAEAVISETSGAATQPLLPKSSAASAEAKPEPVVADKPAAEPSAVFEEIPMPPFVTTSSKVARVEIEPDLMVIRFSIDVPNREWIVSEGGTVRMVGTVDRPLEVYHVDEIFFV